MSAVASSPRQASTPSRAMPLSLPLIAAVAACLTQGASALYKVALSKQHVPVQVKGRTVAHKTAYFGNIHVAYPVAQTFTVVFDTGSAHLFLPSSECTDPACTQHRQYNRAASGTAVDINHDGLPFTEDMLERDQASIAYGTGEVIGEFVREVVCVGAPAASATVNNESQHNCASVRLVTAVEMTSEPFSAFGFDGVLGLALEALALDPEFNFFGQMARGDRIPSIFGVFLARSTEDRSEISFGGYEDGWLAGPLQWVPVESPEFGYWQIRVHGVRIGDETVDECGTDLCTAILDTGTSLLGVPQQSMPTYHYMLARQVPDDVLPPSDCRQFKGPRLSFDVGDGISVDLEAEDYSRPAPMTVAGENNASHSLCRSSLLPVEMAMLGPRVFLWGEPVLRRYFTAYDAQRHRVGLAFAGRNPAPAEAPPAGQAARAHKAFLV